MIDFDSDEALECLREQTHSTTESVPSFSGSGEERKRVTHFPDRSDALVKVEEESPREIQIRTCTGCGRDFVVMRAWQRQCSQRCRQRAYIQRKCAVPHGYYGARSRLGDYETDGND